MQNQVQRPINLQNQKVMEIMMTKMLDDKLREDKMAAHFEQVKVELASSVQGCFSAVMTKFSADLQA